jgi:poly-gamma-glutamate synthesis protein (capsule biosynthesis protein)
VVCQPAPVVADDGGWQRRVDALLVEQPGDATLVLAGDMIYTAAFSEAPEADRRALVRLLREADITLGNLESSLNDQPEARRGFYDFRMPPAFAWELVNLGLTGVTLANNHALDFGPEGLGDCLRALDRANLAHAGAGRTLAEARTPAVMGAQGLATRFALLAYQRYSEPSRSRDPFAPSLAVVDPVVIALEREGGKVEQLEGLLAADLRALQEDVVAARRDNHFLVVSFHVHDQSHARAAGFPDRVPDNDRIMYHTAIEAGADVVFAHGPHVLRGIELYRGRPIFYSLGNFIYQYRTPARVPVDLAHQRNAQLERGANTSVYDARDPERELEGLLVRLTVNAGRLVGAQLLPVTLDGTGPAFGTPRLAGGERGQEILRRLEELSRPYATPLTIQGWYGELGLP